MNMVQIVTKTVITTIDLMVAGLTICADVPSGSKRILVVGVLLNMAGVWI